MAKKAKKDKKSLPHLLPCPFCGDPGICDERTIMLTVVGCVNDKCEFAPHSWSMQRHLKTAIKRWNTRV